jgi:hypothetical protein
VIVQAPLDSFESPSTEQLLEAGGAEAATTWECATAGKPWPAMDARQAKPNKRPWNLSTESSMRIDMIPYLSYRHRGKRKLLLGKRHKDEHVSLLRPSSARHHGDATDSR